MRSGDPSTVSEATEPANMPASKPTSSAMRAERGSNTEPGCTQRSPAKRARKRSRRWVQRMVEASPRLTCFIGGGIRTYPTRLDSLFSPSVVSARSEEHTSELQSLMRISYAVFCLKKKNNNIAHSYNIYMNVLIIPCTILIDARQL